VFLSREAYIAETIPEEFFWTGTLNKKNFLLPGLEAHKVEKH